MNSTQITTIKHFTSIFRWFFVTHRGFLAFLMWANNTYNINTVLSTVYIGCQLLLWPIARSTRSFQHHQQQVEHDVELLLVRGLLCLSVSLSLSHSVYTNSQTSTPIYHHHYCCCCCQSCDPATDAIQDDDILHVRSLLHGCNQSCLYAVSMSLKGLQTLITPAAATEDEWGERETTAKYKG